MSNPIADALAQISIYVPKIHMRPKKTSWLHRAIGKLFSLIGNRTYTEDYFTTIGDEIAYPTTRPPFQPIDTDIMWHEGQHAKDWTWKFPFLYLFPMSLAPFAFVAAAVLGNWWLVLAGLVCMLPLPSPWRVWYELRAYRVNLAMQMARGDVPEWIEPADALASRSYYWAAPRFVTRWLLRRALHQLMEGRNVTDYERTAMAFAKQDAQEQGS